MTDIAAIARQVLPFYARGRVVHGFGKGSKELGIPTANFPDDVVENLPEELTCGVYCGFASVNDGPVYPMCLSIGWNPYYMNTKRTMETHIMHKFDSDFYDLQLKDTKLNVCMLLFFTAMMSLYILVEFAVNMYFFTWMNHNILILPYLGFLWGYWIVRTGLNIMVAIVTHSRTIDLQFQKKYDLLNMPGVNHSFSTASMLSGSMRSVAGQQHIRAMSSQRLYASRQSLQHANSHRSLNRSQQSLNYNGRDNGRGAANF